VADEQQPGPDWDPEVRVRVQRALNQVVRTAQDILTRYTDEHGAYQAPPEVHEAGSNVGLIVTGKLQVLDRLQAELDRARAQLRAEYDGIEAHKRERYGPNYRPLSGPF
jgi:hypothetical protein